jgi:hypothetical protein
MSFNVIVLFFNNSSYINLNKMLFFTVYTYYIGGTKSEAARQAGRRALQRLTSLSRAALSYIASSKRQRT